jgi:hypothetical protein
MNIAYKILKNNEIYGTEQLYTTAVETCVSTKWVDGEEEIAFEDNSFLNFNEDHIYVGGGQFKKPAIDYSVLDLY